MYVLYTYKECPLTHWDRNKMGTFGEGILKFIFLNENIWLGVCIFVDILRNSLPNGSIDNNSALDQVKLDAE